MPIQTEYYKLEYFERGSYYDSVLEKRRFLTLDHNLTSYIGIVGVGIIKGWTVEHTYGINVQILPGKGIIDGYFVESPFSIKQRSSMVSGDREVEIYDNSSNQNGSTSNDLLKDEEKSKYISIIQEYNPSFNPSGDIEDVFVKVSSPYNLALIDNTDNYIYAERPSGAKPYPVMQDYPNLVADYPKRSEYSDYYAFKEALDEYNNQIEQIQNYNWYDNSDNHFTVVSFDSNTSFVASNNKVLIARVTTRNGVVTNIDTSSVKSLEKLQSVLQEYAQEFITNHHHGGQQPFDPPKVNLETDRRPTVLSSYNSLTRQGIFSVLQSNNTSIVQGHQHTYKIDASGNGITIDQIGGGEKHFHKIVNYIVQEQENTLNNILPKHTHTISETSSYEDNWTVDTPYVVYVNNESVNNPIVNVANKNIVLAGDIGEYYRIYSTEFDIFGETYSFEAKANSVLSFMLSMILDFNAKYQEQLNEDYLQSPFVFANESGTAISGLAELKNQSQAAQTLMRKVNDVFTFTPNAANNITITLKEVYDESGIEDDIVEIEILNNVEVLGTLPAENILWLHADKLATGTIDIARIPMISHLGRVEELFLPDQYNLVSNNGFIYYVKPRYTDIQLGHYHEVQLDLNNGGKTTNVLVNNDIVYYGDDNDGNSYFIAHTHSISGGILNNVENQTLLEWQNSVNNVTDTSLEHQHSLKYPVRTNTKTVYSILEDDNSNLFVGTASGLIMVPNQEAYKFVVNGYGYTFLGSNLWTLLLRAKQKYEEDTLTNLNVTEDIYLEQISEAAESLIHHGDSYLLQSNNSDEDEIMIQKLDYFPVPELEYFSEKKLHEVKESEEVVSIKTIRASDGTEIDPDSEEAQNAEPGEIQQIATVKQNVSKRPAWDLLLKNTQTADPASYCLSDSSENIYENKDLFVITPDIAIQGRNLQSSLYTSWNNIDVPVFSGIFRKMFFDNKNLWLVTNNLMFISRPHQRGLEFSPVKRPGFSTNIHDAVWAGNTTIICTNENELYRTTNEGKDWTSILSTEDNDEHFIGIIRDFSIDRTNNFEGHFHYLNVNTYGDGITGLRDGEGPQHAHNVDEWDIENNLSHTHTLQTTIYATTNKNKIYRSINNGISWEEFGSMPEQENSPLFAAFHYIFVSKPDGVYRSIDGVSWTKVLQQTAYSFSYSFNHSKIFVGLNNKILQSADGETFTTVLDFGYTNDGSAPVILNNGEKQYFGYVYSDLDQTINFRDWVFPENPLYALVDFRYWNAKNGGWDQDAEYELFVNNRRIYDTDPLLDNRSENEYYFEINEIDGTLDFSKKAKLIEQANVYASSLQVDDTSNFYQNDVIFVQSEAQFEKTKPEAASFETSQDYYDALNIYYAEKNLYENMEEFLKISTISGNTIFLSNNISKTIEMPAYVYRIPNVGGATNIVGTIYDSYLSNAGKYTHEEIEDALSEQEVGLPFHLSETFLANILQLTQAVKYVYPTIDEYFTNTVFYDFHYEDNNPGATYPYIGDYLDLATNEIYNKKSYDSNQTQKISKKVNRIYFGYAKFIDYVFVCTDTGLFYSKISENMENAWFYVRDVSGITYDCLIFGDDKLYVATSTGTYYSSDLNTWTKISNPSANFRSYTLSLRWGEPKITTITTHTANFVNDITNSVSAIYNSSELYGSLTENRSIYISNAGGNDGSYVIDFISEDGSYMEFEGTFPEGGSFDDVEISMGTWWQRFNGEDNSLNESLINTMIVGGQKRIAISNDIQGKVWQDTNIQSVDNEYIVNKIFSLSSGSAYFVGGGILSNSSNYIFRSKDLGLNWSLLKEFKENRADIVKFGLTDFEHTLLEVNYDVLTSTNQFNRRYARVFSQSAVIWEGYIIASYRDNVQEKNILIVQDSTLFMSLNELSSLQNCYISIDANNVNSIKELSNGLVLFGSDYGLYDDGGSLVNRSVISGTVSNVLTNASIQSIDWRGVILNVTDNGQGKVRFSIGIDRAIYRNQFVQGKAYILNSGEDTAYPILFNSSNNQNREIELDIDQDFDLYWTLNKGRSIIFQGAQTKLFVQFDKIVKNDQFIGGSVWASDGTTYNISANTSNSIDLDSLISPFESELSLAQTLRVVPSSNEIELDVSFSDNVENNALAGFSFTITNSDSVLYGTSLTIKSNTNNKIILDPFSSGDEDIPDAYAITKSDFFEIFGFQFNPKESFNNKSTSVNIDHYHDTELVEGYIRGTIQSISNTNFTYATIQVSNTSNFTDELTQRNQDLLLNSIITFRNPKVPGREFYATVVSHTPSSILVNIEDLAIWDFYDYNPNKISASWKWEIDARGYGYTQNTYYKDFELYTLKIIADALLNTNTLEFSDTSNITVGDKVLLTDESGSLEINFVENILSGTEIELTNAIKRSLYIKNNPVLKVLSNTFTNEHIHYIRNYEVDTLLVSDYLDKGYSLTHSHRIIPYLPEIYDISDKNGEIIVCGSDTKIYNSNNNGETWNLKTDLNDYESTGITLSSLSTLSQYPNDNRFVVGGNNGTLFIENADGNDINPLPEISTL